MPELLEIELYRRLAESSLGREIVEVGAPDAWYLKDGLDAAQITEALVGASFVGARRIGKLLLLDTDGGSTLGLRFGMTGVLEVDGDEGVEQLLYASVRREDSWVRFGIGFADGGALRMRDPRRLGAVELDPAESRLGTDAAAITEGQLRAALGSSAAPLKARLMDQTRVAGLGNLLTDEILWRARLDPARPAGSLDAAERRRLHRHLRVTLDVLDARGGSHTGDLMDERSADGHCPRCGAGLRRRTIGGRTTYSCPGEQG